MQRISVVIANYNYERFLAAAVDSALALRHDDVEVVVVDDGSTDGSAEVLRAYEGRVRVLLTENSGQREAVNRGFAASTGDVVVFLDSDDVLPPELPSHLAGVWTPAVSKVQFQMQRIDVDGRPVGEPFPRYEPVPTPAQVRRWAELTTAYPTPPGSGNAYARWFLEKIFPLPESTGRFADSGCLATAPFLGDVVTVPGVLVGYRQHGANDSRLLADPSRLPREVERARARWRFAQEAAGADPAKVDESALFRSREVLQFRVAGARVAPGVRPLPGDGPLRLLLDVLRSPLHPGPERLGHRLAVVAWSLAVLLAPGRAVPRLLALRYDRA